MSSATAQRTAIRRIDAPGRAWLELKGSILLFHKETWVSSATLYIPVEWVRIEEGRQRDIRLLWQGILGFLVAAAFTPPLTLLLWRDYFADAAGRLFEIATASLVIAGVAAGILSLLLFLRPRPMAMLHVEGAPYATGIAFWRSPPDPALETLLDRITDAHAATLATGLHPIRMNHLWRRPRPYRIATIRGLATSVALFTALQIIEWSGWVRHASSLPPAIYAVLAVPPLVYLGGVFIRRGFVLREPPGFRAAWRAYTAGRTDDAIAALLTFLKDHPEHPLGRILLIRALTERWRLDEGLQQCDRLVDEDPALALRLRTTVWELKRMAERMGEGIGED
jgi:hypothetical protein